MSALLAGVQKSSSTLYKLRGEFWGHCYDHCSACTRHATRFVRTQVEAVTFSQLYVILKLWKCDLIRKSRSLIETQNTRFEIQDSILKLSNQIMDLKLIS